MTPMLATAVTARSSPSESPAHGLLTTPAAVDAARSAAVREVLVAGRHGVDLGRADRDNLRRGVRYRVLVPGSVRADRAAWSRLTGDARIRTVPALPAGAVVIDRSVALFPLPRPADGVVLVAVPGVVDTTVALFEGLWEGAAPLAGDEVTDGRERQLLALMSAGHTDESAAARLGVSVRTVRRMMSALMARLGARSRFQAGLRAAGTPLTRDAVS